jgi:beta-glucosidase
VNAGLDIEMPGPSRWRGEALTLANATDKLEHNALDDCARRVLNLVNDCAVSGVPEHAPETTKDTPETAALLRRLAGESIVLMKNTGNVLPFNKSKKVCIIFTCAD